MTYTMEQKSRAAAWKANTRALPGQAKAPAGYVNKDGQTGTTKYDFCLPIHYASLSLLSEVRAEALQIFAELGIPWHAGIDGGPSNHLLSSQVQCVNALGQMVTDSSRIKRAFGDMLGIAEVLQIEPGRFLTFEYIGPEDYFGEVPKGDRIRGALCTSVDAAFLHRALDGVVELVLVEWKYTESYRLRRPDSKRDAIRRGRYEQAVADPTGPIRSKLLAFELLLDEPFYQLVRQQLLADALEGAGVGGAGRVRVVHVLPPENEAYQQSMHRPEHRALGATVTEVWQKLLRHHDRFMSMDSGIFLDPDVTSREYCLRYAGDVIYDVAGLLTAFELETAEGLEDVLYADHDFDGDVTVRDDEVELLVGREGTCLAFPFLITELRALAAELAVAEEEGEE